MSTRDLPGLDENIHLERSPSMDFKSKSGLELPDSSRPRIGCLSRYECIEELLHTL